jgi:hypothetical protein
MAERRRRRRPSHGARGGGSWVRHDGRQHRHRGRHYPDLHGHRRRARHPPVLLRRVGHRQAWRPGVAAPWRRGGGRRRWDPGRPGRESGRAALPAGHGVPQGGAGFEGGGRGGVRGVPRGARGRRGGPVPVPLRPRLPRRVRRHVAGVPHHLPALPAHRRQARRVSRSCLGSPSGAARAGQLLREPAGQRASRGVRPGRGHRGDRGLRRGHERFDGHHGRAGDRDPGVVGRAGADPARRGQDAGRLGEAEVVSEAVELRKARGWGEFLLLLRRRRRRRRRGAGWCNPGICRIATEPDLRRADRQRSTDTDRRSVTIFDLCA